MDENKGMRIKVLPPKIYESLKGAYDSLSSCQRAHELLSLVNFSGSKREVGLTVKFDEIYTRLLGNDGRAVSDYTDDLERASIGKPLHFSTLRPAWDSCGQGYFSRGYIPAKPLAEHPSNDWAA